MLSQGCYGSDLIVDLMKHYGIRYASLNPGSSFRGLHDSIVNYGGNCPEIIECPHEKIAVGMAHGYAKVTGDLSMVTILHDTVGLLHGSLGIYQAYADRVPMMVLGATGPMEVAARRPRVDWDHTALVQGNAVRDFVKWDDQPVGAEAVVESFARAYRVALAEPQGPIYLCYDVSFQEEEVARPVSLPNQERARVYTPMQADPSSLEKAAEWLTQAERPVIVADYLGRNADTVAVLVELADLLAAPVIDLNGRFNFPNQHPLWCPDRKSLREADCVLLLDVRDPYGCFSEVDMHLRQTTRILPDGCRVVEFGVGDLGIHGWSYQYQRFQEVDLSVLADTKVALPALLAACRERVAAGHLPSQSSAIQNERRMDYWRGNQDSRRQKWLEQASVDWDARPMTTARLASEVWTAIRDRDWVLTANTLSEWTRRLWHFDRPYRHLGKSLGTATQIGISLGAALAHKGTGRLVVDIQPDGDLMYDLSSLWVAAHHHIPMLVIMFNNRAYVNSWEHQAQLAHLRGRDESNAYVGMEIDGPAPDFAGVARSLGWYAEGPIDDGSQVQQAVRRAIRAIEEDGKPALVDCVTRFR